MVRIVALMVLFMGMIFMVVSNLAAKKSGQQTVNPISDFARGLVNTLNNADRLAPDLSRAIDRAENGLPKLIGKDGDKSTTALKDFTDSDFSGQNHPKAMFAGALVTNAKFINTLLDGSTFEGATGETAVFRKARLAGATFDASVFRNADFSQAELRGATARAADMTGANFSGADLSFAKFSAFIGEEAIFTAAYVTGAVLSDAHLRGANFEGADATGVQFHGADLSAANFTHAKVEAAIFTGAKLYGADLSTVIGATTDQFAGACGDAETKLPGGATAPACE
jgi:uncharacterized protein YjbI with pentapeptide repeats